MQSISEFNRGLLAFLDASPTPFHAAQEMARQLSSAGFTRLLEADNWALQPGGRYFVLRNGSSIAAFSLGDKAGVDGGFRIVGAHTDSPCLKVKPTPELHSKGYFQLGVEVYGGALLNPWFDRDLSLAGRVVYRGPQGEIKSALIDYQRPLATIPSLAIHLDREANKARSINAQQHLPPVLMQVDTSTTDFRALLLKQLLVQHPDSAATAIVDYELSFYDTQGAAVIGFAGDFIAGARLDNLLSCYIALQGMLTEVAQANSRAHTTVLICNDHEEVGSMSAAGAQGPMLSSILRRMVASETDYIRAMACSMLISADNAHGIHPNYVDMHDSNHGPLLNGGPVIKTNANQRYATDSETSAIFRQLCEQVDEPVQCFVTRSDMACGSTIGPITAGELGIKALDVGVPTFAMHSIRELAGSRDAYALLKVLQLFNSRVSVVVK